MQRPLKISSRDFELTEAVESQIRERAEWLETFYGRLSGCEVTVEAPAIRHHRHGGPYIVRVHVTAPGKDLMVDHQEEEELSQAIREAFDAARRQLEDHLREQRRWVKSHEETPTGRVVQLEKALGYGFIATSDGREIYFHSNSVLNGDFDQLEIGTEVRYAEEEGEKGPQASTVAITGKRRA